MTKKIFAMCILIFTTSLLEYSQGITWNTSNELIESGSIKNEVEFKINDHTIRVRTVFGRIEIYIDEVFVASVESDLISSLPSSSSIVGDFYFNIWNSIPSDIKICYSKNTINDSSYNIIYFLLRKENDNRLIKILMVDSFDKNRGYSSSPNIIYYFTELCTPP